MQKLERLLAYSPLTKAYEAGTCDCLKVLAYHTVVDPKQLEQQFKFLIDHFNIIDIHRLEAHLFQNQPLPERPLLITFDDGDRSVYEKGFPILTKLEIPVILFVITNLIGTYQPFWWEEVNYFAPEHLTKKEKHRLLLDMKKLPTSERIAHLKALKKSSGKLALKRCQLKLEELMELEANGITIANHTHTHPLLDLTDVAVIEDELRQSIYTLREHGFEGYKYFAYPNGNVSQLAEDILSQYAIRLAFLFDHKVNDQNIHPLRISRLSVNSDTSIDKLKLILSGAHTALLKFRSKLSG